MVVLLSFSLFNSIQLSFATRLNSNLPHRFSHLLTMDCESFRSRLRSAIVELKENPDFADKSLDDILEGGSCHYFVVVCLSESVRDVKNGYEFISAFEFLRKHRDVKWEKLNFEEPVDLITVYMKTICQYFGGRKSEDHGLKDFVREVLEENE